MNNNYGNNFNFSTNALLDDNFRGSAIGAEVCTIADGDPSIDLEALRRYAPENGISTKYLLTGQRKRAEPYQSILLNQQEPVVQPTGTYNLVNTSTFGSGEPTFENLENGQGNIPGYKKRFPQLQSRPGPNEMVPKDSGGLLRGVDVYDFDSKDPVSGKAPKEQTILGSEIEMQEKVNQTMQAYQHENALNAKTLPFQASNWAATHPELVNDMDGNIPVYSPDGQVITNIKTKATSIPLPNLEEAAREQAAKEEEAKRQAQARAAQMAAQQAAARQNAERRAMEEQMKKQMEESAASSSSSSAAGKKKPGANKSMLGFILLVVTGVIVIGVLIAVIFISSSSSSSSAKKKRQEEQKVREEVIKEPESEFIPVVPSAPPSFAGYYF